MRSTRANWIKFATFFLVAGLMTVYVAVVVGNLDFNRKSTYHALFNDVSQLASGSPVRVAGVDVGSVTGVQINDGGSGADAIKVTFQIDADVEVPADVAATVRFKNLIGDQYLELVARGRGERNQTAGPEGDLEASDSLDSGTLEPGATIPSERTTSSLDLDTLYNGFQPLFQGLNAAQVNELSSAIVDVLNGQEGAVYQLVDEVGSLFETLGENQALISQVIDNLSGALAGVAQRSSSLDRLVVDLERLVSGLAKDRRPILGSLENVSALAKQSAELLGLVRPPLRSNVDSIRATADELNRQTDTLQFVLDNLAPSYDKLVHTGSYGAMFNFLICGLRLKITGLNGPMFTPWTFNNLDRCKRLPDGEAPE